jgi:signal transduction histidine kinase
MIALTIVPVCIGIAVLRAGLWDVDRVVNRTIVYGLLTTAVVAIYVVVVTYLGAQLRSVPLLVSLIATGAVAVLLQPLHRLLQRTVNRLMFGLRDEPTAVMTQLGRRLQDTAEPDAVLAMAAQTLARALRLPYAAVRLRDGTEAGWGEPATATTTAPLVFQGREVGELLLAPRRPGERLTARDLALVAQVAPQVAAAADAILLTSDLRASRTRLVETREDERRRLRRDLHDGLGPALAGLALQAAAIPQVTSTDPDTAARLGEQVAAGIRGVIADVRRLVYGLRPPALDEFGLVEGLRSTAAPLERPGIFRVTVEASEPLPPLPAAVEAAAYRIGVEAIANAARHADASRCTVRVGFDGGLRIDVEDDGVGLRPGTVPGVGLLSMRERAAEVGGAVRIESRGGGGTVVTARLPMPASGWPSGSDEQEDRCAS